MRINAILLILAWGGIFFAGPAQAAPRQDYVIAFIPLNWSGSLDKFEAEARRQGEFFVAESGIAGFADAELVVLNDRLDGASLRDPWLIEEVVAFGLQRHPADRYIGLTDGDLAPEGSSSVVGWTGGPDSAGIVVETGGIEISAHELGHTFALCDEYLYSYWERQNEAWTCPNPYPANCSKAKDAFCDGLPAPDGNHSIMGPDGLPGEYSYNQPGWDHLQSVFAALFSVLDPDPTPPGPGPEATPLPTPLPTPGPLSATILFAKPHLVRLASDGTVKELLSEPVLHPAWSPESDWIAYASVREGTLDIYRIPATGGPAQRLTDLPARESHPAWLPGGERLIFAADGDGNSALYTLDIHTKAIQPMIGLPLPASWPAVAPDGRKLAFSAAPEGDWELYLVELNEAGQPVTGTLTRLTTSTGADISPAWNSDVPALAFASARNGSMDLYELRLEDLVITHLTSSLANEWAPRWLADGRIVYQAYDGANLAIWLLDPATGSSKLVTADGEQAAWPTPEPWGGAR